MAKALVLRALLGTSLGLGAADVIWLDLAIAPAVVAGSPAPVPGPVAPVPAVAPSTAAQLDVPVEPPAAPVPAPIARVERVYFESLRTDLSLEARTTLAALATAATANIVVIGHSDHRGDPDLNRTLRMRRAIAVRDHLALLGVSSERVHVRAAEPAAPTDEPELWRDRRTEIHYTVTGGSP